MLIKVKEIFDMAFSYENGMDLRRAINDGLKSGEKIIVDFSDITVFTTMFFNACSGHYVLNNSLEWYNQNIECINLSELGEQTHKHSIENAERKRDSFIADKNEELSRITSKTIAENA